MLEQLRARRHKALELGPEVIYKHKPLYDEICDMVFRLQHQSIDPDQQLVFVMEEIIAFPWPVKDYWPECQRYFPDLTGSVERLGKEIDAALNHAHPDRARWLIPKYRRAWHDLADTADRLLVTEMEGLQIYGELTPWDKGFRGMIVH